MVSAILERLFGGRNTKRPLTSDEFKRLTAKMRAAQRIASPKAKVYEEIVDKELKGGDSLRNNTEVWERI